MKKPVIHDIKVITKRINKIYTHKGVNVLTVDIEYPYIYYPKRLSVQMKINNAFRYVANSYNSYAVTTLKPNAIDQYEASIKQDFPFHPFEAVMKYTITLNDDCTLSAYYDQYQYTGGAHGMTVRTSDTFNTRTGNKMPLEHFFINVDNYREVILKELIKKAEANEIKQPGTYFPNYKQLIVETFNKDSFFLTDKYFNFYFQQYDIAPYAAGIIVLNIPYKNLGIEKPKCYSVIKHHTK